MTLPAYLPILITGVNGVPGYNAFRHFHSQYPEHVVAIRPTRYWPLRGEGIIPLDIEDVQGLAALMKTWKFNSILHAAGSCALKSCELNPEMAYRVNVQSAKNILKIIGDRTIRLLFLSTDLVFPGKSSGCYTESDAVSPVTVYGKTMVMAEEIIAHEYPSAVIFRISLPMGISVNGHAGAIDWILSRFKKNNPATLYYDEIRSPFYCEDFNSIAEIALENKICGIYHLGSHRYLSLYQIGQIVNKVGGYSPRLLKGCMRIEAGPMPPRAGNVAMSNKKLLAALGFDPFRKWPYHENHVPDKHDWHYDRPDHKVFYPEQIHKYLYRIPIAC
ncbi:dTDP-4-dehydrorhamnose reductase [Candidatus Kuenenia stuttgartiensis]|jgi:dTDP-4-dehydrorhamnose reductase|uniref:Similar to TDP-rhamnose synthetase, NAD(P)-binding n=1 Tax=Kuenenia stuttgartiensis TaxID=174633 RepID=Q1PZM3_KUEST|nr:MULTISPECIES: sugar nucleotide-binding protein [Kuenenia]MBE7546680.1 NAD(P)-dependent oxidoreductase [Planctomycetia bacterium]MBW7942396.1 NAD(P)-dependent oxidoreductase [Candidatus Kuenenia stuttgartiensis]MBZ0191241.1 sugar nucleotide-binding protein [Candidatus Kuenenia stuttgartiensis]MCF6152738.1 NAD(P)-dependent oxidoreductase [Candidatus Kuenenia stuttgartiensis]MCL4725921.1 sugar nucleotide-binding protein [Candidatus Kuenenia stuttgartiensis]